MTDPEFEFGSISEGWMSVDGPGLDRPISIKAREQGAGLRIVGIKVDDEGGPITSETLRSIPIGRLTTELTKFVADLLADLPDAPELKAAIDAVQPRAGFQNARGHLTDAEEGLLTDLEMAAALVNLERWVAAGPDAPDEATDLASRGRGARPPEDDEYRQFSRVYREELKSGRGAKVRTARRIGMDRSTVYRWIRECQNRGFLPQEVE